MTNISRVVPLTFVQDEIHKYGCHSQRTWAVKSFYLERYVVPFTKRENSWNEKGDRVGYSQAT